MTLKLVFLVAGIVPCSAHPSANAIKCIGDWSLCPACCEDFADQLMEGVTPDPVEVQSRQEWKERNL